MDRNDINYYSIKKVEGFRVIVFGALLYVIWDAVYKSEVTHQKKYRKNTYPWKLRFTCPRKF